MSKSRQCMSRLDEDDVTQCPATARFLSRYCREHSEPIDWFVVVAMVLVAPVGWWIGSLITGWLGIR